MKTLDLYISAYVNDLGIGAYGVIIEENGNIVELSECSKKATTGRRIRLSGLIAALHILSESREATIYIDSEYIVKTFNKGWAKTWRRQNWRTSGGEKAKNADLWDTLLNLTEKHNLNFVLIRGHNGYEYGHEYNARCVELAIEAVKRG